MPRGVIRYADAIRLHVDALDVALVHQPLQIDVGEPERDAQLARQPALRDVRVLVDGFEQLQVAMCFNVHSSHSPGVPQTIR